MSLKNVHVEPDALFGVRYPPREDPDFNFFAVEYDRGTEDVEPTANLTRASWLRKILAYSAISEGTSPIYQTYLKIPTLSVLCIFSDEARMMHAMKLAGRHASDPDQFLFKTIPPIDPLTVTTPLPGLFSEPWQRMKGLVRIDKVEQRR